MWGAGNVGSGREYSSLINSAWKKRSQSRAKDARDGAGMLTRSLLCEGAKSKDFTQAQVLSCSDLLLKDVLDGCTAVRPKKLVVEGRSLPPQTPS